MQLKGKTVLITGASTGIGKAIAEAFLAKGARVIVFGQHKPALTVDFHKVNVADEKQVKTACVKIGKIDVLVNNAGVSHVAKLNDIETGKVNEQIDVNLKGVIWMTKYAQLNDGASIINISSVAGQQSFEGFGVYSATKAALLILTKTMVIEFSNRNIRANAICPGIIDTGIWEKQYGKDGRKEFEESINYVRLKRAGKPENIASAAIFLAENDYVSGAVLNVDGGGVTE
ncbi:MAG: SDR family oxidoreductase [Candidatus Woesearchaeota archaeon]